MKLENTFYRITSQDGKPVYQAKHGGGLYEVIKSVHMLNGKRVVITNFDSPRVYSQLLPDAIDLELQSLSSDMVTGQTSNPLKIYLEFRKRKIVGSAKERKDDEPSKRGLKPKTVVM